MKLSLTGNNVIVKRKQPDSKVGRILLPDQAKGKSCEGMVLHVGPGRISSVQGCGMPRPTSAKLVGDTVVFGLYAGSEIEENGEKLLILSQDDLLAIRERRCDNPQHHRSDNEQASYH